MSTTSNYAEYGQLPTMSVEDVARIMSGGDSDLPAVTTDDNGDVLTVVSGAWSKADPPTGLPAVTGADNGKVLGVAEGGWTKVDPTGGDPLELTGTFGKVDNKDAITIDKTASELFKALKNGAFVKMVVELEAAGVTYRNDVTGFVSSGKLAGENELTIFSFAFFTPDGKFMVCDEAAGTDTVVFTEV